MKKLRILLSVAIIVMLIGCMSGLVLGYDDTKNYFTNTYLESGDPHLGTSTFKQMEYSQ